MRYLQIQWLQLEIPGLPNNTTGNLVSRHMHSDKTKFISSMVCRSEKTLSSLQAYLHFCITFCRHAQSNKEDFLLLDYVAMQVKE